MDNNIYYYKMTHNTEFAPNPHFDVLTLATCKPVIRRCAKVGDWISGWTAKVVTDKDNNKLSFPKEKLIYLARITGKMTFAEYWEKYPMKRNTAEFVSGDNIYEPIGEDEYRQIDNPHHGQDCIERDLRGKYVLICEEFYYFGVQNNMALDIPSDIVPFPIPRCKKLELTQSQLVEYITAQYNVGINNHK